MHGAKTIVVGPLKSVFVPLFVCRGEFPLVPRVLYIFRDVMYLGPGLDPW